MHQQKDEKSYLHILSAHVDKSDPHLTKKY